MSFAKNSVAIVFAGLASLAIPAVAFAQAGGADVPDNAKAQGEKEQPGSTGKSDAGSMKKDGGSMEKSGSMEKGGDKK